MQKGENFTLLGVFIGMQICIIGNYIYRNAIYIYRNAHFSIRQLPLEERLENQWMRKEVWFPNTKM